MPALTVITSHRRVKPISIEKTFGSVLTALRTGQIKGLKKNENDQLTDILMHQSQYRLSAMEKYRELGKSNPDDTLFRSIASYGEVGNDANDLITLTTLARRAAGVNEDDDFAGYEAVDGHLIHNDGVAGEEDWNRVVGKIGIPYGAATEMGYDPDIELNKIRHMKLANNYSDMLADSRAKKKIAHAAMDGLTVGEILEKVDSPNQRHSSQHPIYAGHSDAWGDKYLQENYYKEASTETKAKLKPGAFMMLNGRDAEVYQVREDGALMTPEGKVWGHVDFKTGRVHNAYGENIFVSHNGARVYANEEELLRYAALDDVEEMPAGGIVGATSSSDPGYRSRYEDDAKLSKKFDRAIKHLKQEEKALTFKARMQEEYGRAVAKHSSEDLYTIATSKFGMPPFSKEIAEDNSPNGILRREIAKVKELSRKDMALASEYSIQDALNRHKMKDPSLKVEVMPLQLKNQRGLALW